MQLYTRAEGTLNIIIKILNPIDYKQLSFYLGRITRFKGNSCSKMAFHMIAKILETPVKLQRFEKMSTHFKTFLEIINL